MILVTTTLQYKDKCAFKSVGLSLYIVISIITRLYNPLGGLNKSAIRAERCLIKAVGCHRGWRTVAPSADLHMITSGLHVSRCIVRIVH